MTEEIIIAGFGGQGVLSMGKIMAYSGVMQDMEVSWTYQFPYCNALRYGYYPESAIARQV